MNAITSRLLAALTYPRAVEDLVELAFPLHSTSEVRARVIDVKRETEDVATLVLQPNDLWRGHKAGQHIALTVEVRGVRRTRCFSVASAEEDNNNNNSDRTISITIKAQPNGAVTPFLISGDLRGKIVTLSQAAGDFVLPDTLPARLLLISGGSGITPVMSMLRTLLDRGALEQQPAHEIVFVHYARSKADIIFAKELHELAIKAAPQLRIQIHTGQFFQAAHLADLGEGFEAWSTYACGPEPFLKAVKNAFAARGAEHQVHVERFSLVTTDLNAANDNNGANLEGEVTFAKSKKQSRGKGPLLPMAEAAGLNPPSGCRMGICHTCTCRKISGVTRNLRTGELSTDANVDIQLCVNAPVGAVELDL